MHMAIISHWFAMKLLYMVNSYHHLYFIGFICIEFLAGLSREPGQTYTACFIPFSMSYLPILQVNSPIFEVTGYPRLHNFFPSVKEIKMVFLAELWVVWAHIKGKQASKLNKQPDGQAISRPGSSCAPSPLNSQSFKALLKSTQISGMAKV